MIMLTELKAAGMLESYMNSQGVERFLHRPFAWFGERSRFDDCQGYENYHPTSRVLKEEDVITLDVAPILNGFIGDVGYSFSLTPNPQLEKARALLIELRNTIPNLFMSDRTLAEIWLEVDRIIEDAGYDNIHARYPFCTLGHRVFKVKVKEGKGKNIGPSFLSWFPVDINLTFIKTGPSIILNAENRGKKLGLWAIEPHIGWPGGGAKFEEILVVEGDRAYWLDNDVPHVQLSK